MAKMQVKYGFCSVYLVREAFNDLASRCSFVSIEPGRPMTGKNTKYTDRPRK
jgi:hypothetical protein